MRPYSIEAEGSGADDGDEILTTERVSSCNEHVIHCTAGTVKIEVSVDEDIATPSRAQTYTDYSSFPISVMLLNTTAPSTWVTSIASGQAAVLTGRYDRVRLRQSGSTAATAHISSYNR